MSETIAVNQLVKMLNTSTEREMTDAEGEEFLALQAETEHDRMADNATIRALRALREGCIDRMKREAMVHDLNAGPHGRRWRFLLVNSRITAQPR